MIRELVGKFVGKFVGLALLISAVLLAPEDVPTASLWDLLRPLVLAVVGAALVSPARRRLVGRYEVEVFDTQRRRP